MSVCVWFCVKCVCDLLCVGVWNVFVCFVRFVCLCVFVNVVFHVLVCRVYDILCDVV